MSDKSFGDHANRNIVKNPLLSTAVTGLSIEDLTHNAVLLPAAPTQALITRSEHQIETRTHTLGHPENELANHSAGDTNSNILPSHQSTTTVPNTLEHHATPQEDKTHVNFSSTSQPKASSKSEDDFDVNEYFARLQGSRYVSAPLNSQIPDNNANLTATEENLEEINLNDDKTEVQHSLTSDIAQNFSQLPTVLPHMASAVFSSFSSMLNLKSREQTPDERQPLPEQVQEETVPLLSVEKSPIDVPPPPKEPPISGPSNYRITTKKKYAQIPGLSSGESQTITYNPVTHIVPSYFVPTQDGSINKTQCADIQMPVETTKIAEVVSTNITHPFNVFDSNTDNKTNIGNVLENDKKFDEVKPPAYEHIFNTCNPNDNEPKATSNLQSNLEINELNFHDKNAINSAVIPPPPMFSTQRRDTQTSGKSVLPPSVARRIKSNHPVIKQNIGQTSMLVDNNIFVPSFDPAPTSTDFTSQAQFTGKIIEPSQTAVIMPQTLTSTNNTFLITPQARISPLPAKSLIIRPPSIASMDRAVETVASVPPHPISFSSFPVSSHVTFDSQSTISTTEVSQLPPCSVIPEIFASTISANAPDIFTPYATAVEPLPKSTSTIFLSTATSSPLLPQIPSTVFSTTISTSIPVTSLIFAKQSVTNVPPVFSNPVPMNNKVNSDTAQFYGSTNEAAKSVIEPPKSVGPINYRMTKKKPQYYSGPIEGVGAISSNTKPVLPPIETRSFQGALFTPHQAEPNVNDNISSRPFDISQSVSSIPQSTMNFDISKPTDTKCSSNIDVTQNYYDSSYFNTAFDLSRPTTDNYNTAYEEPKEAKGFGIIGSLKSKLSSIDINKIQNTVTTFFDPAYNDSKKNDSRAQKNSSNISSSVQYQSLGNFEVFVPDVQQNLPTSDIYNSQNLNAFYQDTQFYSNQYNYCQNQETSNYNISSSQNQQSNSKDNMDLNVFESQKLTDIENKTGNNASFNLFSDNNQVFISKLVDNTTGHVRENRGEIVDTHQQTSIVDSAKIEPTHEIHDKESAINFFVVNTSMPIDVFSKHEKTEDKSSYFHTNEECSQMEEKNNCSTELLIPEKINTQCQDVPAFRNQIDSDPVSILPGDTKSIKHKKDLPKADNLLESISKDKIPIVAVSSVPLFGLSTMVADLPEDSIKGSNIYDVTEDFNRRTSISFFENIAPLDPEEVENVSELNICETCREFNKPEEKENREIEDLTTQLIENITSPIQLSNAVEVPLSEANTNTNDNNEFDKSQYEEICHITEETIEAIHVQSAAELLDDINTLQPINYGWIADGDYSTVNVNAEHDYSFKIDPNTVGFYGNNSLFFENVPTNASDEIKAEFKHSEEFPRQISIPSAPPAEEDTKSDETGGLDVHSIEQDAKEDFPIYEEFIIEPSETDDDKIEFKEREKIEEIPEKDTFTNRIERFKKQEEVVNEGHTSIFELPNQPISMASYFDTGNFAVETHYRNSISSPIQISIPPGFEEQFQYRLMLAKTFGNVRIIPDTSTQTRTTQAVTFSTVKNSTHVGFNIETNTQQLVEDNNANYPVYSYVLGAINTTPNISGGFINFIDNQNISSIRDPKDDINQIYGITNARDSPLSTNLIKNENVSIPYNFQDEYKHVGTSPDTSSGVVDNNLFSERHSSAFNDNVYTDMPIRAEFKLAENSIFTTELTQQNSDKHLTTLLRGSSNSLATEIEDSDFSTVFASKYTEEDIQTKVNSTNFIVDTIYGTTDKTKRIATVSNLTNPIINLVQESQNVTLAESVQNNYINTPEKTMGSVTSGLFEERKSNSFGPKETTQIQHDTFHDDKSNELNKLPDVSSNLDSKIDTKQKEEQKIPDPMSFFATEDNSVEAPESFNRLASYFVSPPKTDHAKSFFELSQSQNHYRHAPSKNDSIKNINDSKYINLMKDLISPENIKFSKDHIDTNVHYSSIEYDLDIKEFEFSNGDRKTKDRSDLAEIEPNELIENIFIKCKYCSKYIYCDKDYNIRQFMNNTGETEKNTSNMDVNGAKDTSKKAASVNFEGIPIHDEANEGVAILSEGHSSAEYAPVKHHWFYRVDVEDKSIWRGFSLVDSKALETAYLSPELSESTLVPTDGGRYDVNVLGRLRIPVYWNDTPTNVRRCSWFYKGTTDARYVPYTEQVAEKLEEEYRHGVTRGEWHRRMVLPNGEVVVMHGPGVMVHFLHSSAADTFSGATSARPRVVRRGCDEAEIEDSEPSSVDHLLLLCHGVGSACDMRFRSVEEVVEDFRATSLQLLQSHYRNSYDRGIVSRVEVLPISWHASLHSGETGVDRRLAQITLNSIPRLRHFTNDTILDVLFYTSPVFSQTIVDTVCSELNRVYNLFKQRNPDFKGGVSLGGHSLGSVILYDLLCNQSTGIPSEDAKLRSDKTYVTGSPGVSVEYPTLAFSPDALYALGSPIAIFECIRGVESLGLNFGLPTCRNFFNIFHPYDPIAYRIEPLINPKLRELKPFLIPHHKGRKRMHLELKDTMARVGADLKQKLVESLKATWNKWRTQPSPNGQLSNVVEEDLDKEQLNEESKDELSQDSELSTPEMLGHLNDGRRVDYVLQEAPLEMINEYIFAMSSHVGYWESEDTMLLMLREIYGALGVQPDSVVPQQTMTVQRARTLKPEETIALNASDYPSTSHSSQ